MSGSVVDGLAGSVDLDLQDMNQWYEVNFENDGTATIQTMNNEYIGFSGTQLSPEKSYWQVFHEDTRTAFYTMVDEKTYMLYPEALIHDTGTDTYFYSTQLVETFNIGSVTTVLLSTEMMMEEPVLTCYPQYGLGFEDVKANGKEYVIPFGIYNLMIINGKKELRLR